MVSDAMRDEANQTLLTTSEAANMLNAHPNTVRKWADAGLLNCYRVGSRGHRRFPLDGLKRYLAEARGIADPYAPTPAAAS